MKNPTSRNVSIKSVSAIAAGFLVSAFSAQAVIVSGTSGTGTNNAGEASLQAYLGTTSYNAFQNWNNLVRVNDASGVYLGYNASTGTGWVLGANHVRNPGAITVAGTSYTVVSAQQVGTTDLYLMQIGGAGASNLSALPTVNLATSAAVVTDFTLMTGRGYTTTTSATAPYAWGGTTTSDAQGMRWGTNTVFSVGNQTVNGITSNYTVTQFDSVLPTAYEAQGAIGDSGGGLFIYRSGQWVLAGIAHYVQDPDDLSPTPVTNPSEYGDRTGYTSISTYRTQINAITGALIPEPTTAILSGIAAITLLARRRRGR